MSRNLERARVLLARPGAWLDGGDGRYCVRLDADRRRRASVTLDEAAFRALVQAPGLRVRLAGGWQLRAATTPAPAAEPGRPGVVYGERTVAEADGRLVRRRANAGESPIAWLARRRDAAGAPYLTRAEAAAGERLRADAERALAGPSLTMRWDALPRPGAGGAPRPEPGEAALAADRRVQRALAAVDPLHRPLVEAVCIRASSLQLAEQSLGLRRRTGRLVLKAALQALARHYGGD